MNDVVKNFQSIKASITNSNVKIIAISKTFSIETIKPLINYGHNHFGENKVQETYLKWTSLKSLKPSIQLHMVGKLQSNKAKEAIKLFDYIHSLDNVKLASLLSKFENSLKKKRKYFIQVNIGREKQKSGILTEQLDSFYNFCTKELNLNIIGLMTIPPNDGNVKTYFKGLMELNYSLGLQEISMGMSSDFIEAVKYKATFVRIGTAIFGNRN